MINIFRRALHTLSARTAAGRPFSVDRQTSPYADPYALQTTQINSTRIF